jgi:hypothetical protein
MAQGSHSEDRTLQELPSNSPQGKRMTTMIIQDLMAK